MRVLLDNGICLCANCHMNGIHSPDWKTQKDFNEKIYKVKGKKIMDKLLLLRTRPIKVTLQDLEDIRQEYKELLESEKKRA